MGFTFATWKRCISYGKQSFASCLDATHKILISRTIYPLSLVFLEPNYCYSSVLPKVWSIYSRPTQGEWAIKWFGFLWEENPSPACAEKPAPSLPFAARADCSWFAIQSEETVQRLQDIQVVISRATPHTAAGVQELNCADIYQIATALPVYCTQESHAYDVQNSPSDLVLCWVISRGRGFLHDYFITVLCAHHFVTCQARRWMKHICLKHCSLDLAERWQVWGKKKKSNGK